MTSNAIALHQTDDEPAHAMAHPSDREIAERMLGAIADLQQAMDSANLAGLMVEPNFSRIENRLTQCGMRIDSFVCKVHVYRKLT